jgi:hypothetical protein
VAEIARLVGIGTSGVAMAVIGMNEKTKLNEMNAAPSDVPEKKIKGFKLLKKKRLFKKCPGREAGPERWRILPYEGNLTFPSPGTLLGFLSCEASSTQFFFSSSLNEFGSLNASKGHKNLFPALSFTHTKGSVFNAMVSPFC